MAHLTIISGSSRGKIFQLEAATCRIGRDADVEVPINDVKASRIHVEIESKDGQYVMRDMKSKNGTLVNGTSVSALTLKEGDQIQIGETRLAFSMQDAPGPRTGKNFDSMMAARMPVGVVAALGSGGRADKAGTEAFETIELGSTLHLIEPRMGETDDFAKINPDAIQRTRHDVRALRALFKMAFSLAQTSTEPQFWAILSECTRVAVEADRVTPVILHEKGHWDAAETGIRTRAKGKAAFTKVPVSRTIVDYALRTRRSVMTAPFARDDTKSSEDLTSVLCVPLLADMEKKPSEVLGLIYADRLGGKDFSHDDHEWITAACMLAAPLLRKIVQS